MAVATDTLIESIVTIDPDVMSGTPVFRGTRVPVKNLLDYLTAGDSLDDFLDHFPTVKREQATTLIGSIEELVRIAANEASDR